MDSTDITTDGPKPSPDTEEEEDEARTPGNGSEEAPSVLSARLRFPRHSRVVLTGLRRTPGLNGCLAVVEGFLHEASRYECRVVSRRSKRNSRTNKLSVHPTNLSPAPASAFVLAVPANFNNKSNNHTSPKLELPLECRVEWDDRGEQLVVTAVLSAFWGTDARDRAKQALLEPPGRIPCAFSKEDPLALATINTPIDYEEHLYEDQYVEGDEILVVPRKGSLPELLLDALLDHELLEETGVLAAVGLHGEIPLCRLRFPFDPGDEARVPASEHGRAS